MADIEELNKLPMNPPEKLPPFVGLYPSAAKVGEAGPFNQNSRYLGTPRGESVKYGATTVRASDLTPAPKFD